MSSLEFYILPIVFTSGLLGFRGLVSLACTWIIIVSRHSNMNQRNKSDLLGEGQEDFSKTS